MKATHILLDLLPPHPKSSMSPTIEQRGFIEHRDRRKVLCGYWAQECLRIEGVADTGFWDLAGWDDTDQDESVAVDDVVVVSDDDDEDQDGTYGPPKSQSGRTRGSERILKRRRLGTRTSGASAKAVPNGQSARAPGGPGSRGGGRGRGTVRGRGRGAGPSHASQRAAAGSSRAKTDTGEIDNLESEDEGVIEPLTPESNAPTSQRNAAARTASSHSLPGRQLAERPQSGRQRTRKRRKGLKELTPAEIQAQYDYFLTFTQQQLGLRVPENSKVGSVHTVKQWMILDVQDMWVEARTKYCRRNLDTMCIMLSTWRTARVRAQAHCTAFSKRGLIAGLQPLAAGPAEALRLDQARHHRRQGSLHPCGAATAQLAVPRQGAEEPGSRRALDIRLDVQGVQCVLGAGHVYGGLGSRDGQGRRGQRDGGRRARR